MQYCEIISKIAGSVGPLARLDKMKRRMAWAGKKGKRRLLDILLIMCIGISIFCIYGFGKLYYSYKTARDEYRDILAIAREEKTDRIDSLPASQKEAEGQGENTSEDEFGFDGEYISPINFGALQELNPEIAAWLWVPGTAIDYPVVQGIDNSVYLKKTVKGTDNVSGAIFFDFRNARDFSDKNTVIYGHNMKDGSMFSSLNKYRDQEFYDDYPFFIIYSPECEYHFRIASVCIIPDESIVYSLNIIEEKGFSEYAGNLLLNNLVNTGTDLSLDDHRVTLSTCEYQYDNLRLVVIGKLEKRIG